MSENVKNALVKITVIDLGNMFIKYMGVAKGNFSSRISNDYIGYEDGFERAEIDGRITYFGTGELSREFNKAERDYTAQLLYAISKANPLEDCIETNLTLLLPTIQMKNKTKLIENLKGKEFSPKVNGKDKVIKINDVLVLPEGYISYFSLSNEKRSGDLALIDIGSRTINLALLVDGKIQKIETIKLGSFDFYSKIKAIENSSGEDFTEEEIPRLIKSNIIKVYQKQYAEFLNEILNSIKPYCNLKTYKCLFTGGTSLMLQQYIIKLPLPSVDVLENADTSNVIGAMIASKKMWGVA